MKKFSENFSYRGSKDIKIPFQFREEDGECGFYSYFSLDDLFNYKNSFSGEKTDKIKREIREFIKIGESKFSHYLRVSFIGFSFSQGYFIERECLKGIDYFHSETVFNEKRGKIDITTCGFHCNDYFMCLRDIFEDREEIVKAGHIIRELRGEEDFFILPYAGDIELIFRHIYTNYGFHFSPSHFYFSRGDRLYASLSILQFDSGLETQSTYSEKGRQESNSLSGLKTQVTCELPASSFH